MCLPYLADKRKSVFSDSMIWAGQEKTDDRTRRAQSKKPVFNIFSINAMTEGVV